MPLPAALVARPIPGLLALRDAREPIRVLIASLAPGGAERIVIEWLGAEAARGRDVELAVLHARRNALCAPGGVRVQIRDGVTPESFLANLAARWRGSVAPVSTHLVTDAHLRILWEAGVRTVPTVHNARDGWRNDPGNWAPEHVPAAVACAEAVRRQMLEAGCAVPVAAIRHRPAVGAAAFDPQARRAQREALGLAPSAFVLCAIGALKPQKDYPRAIDVLAALAAKRDAALVVLGGILDAAGLPELDRLMDAALARGVAGRLRLPGFVPDVAPYLAACDALVNVSRFEGLSIAVQEALAAGLPVVATRVGGQEEITHPALTLVEPSEPADAIASRLLEYPVRGVLEGDALPRAPRAWSLPLAWREARGRACETLFVTANLNAGGAQRSLANLCRELAARHPLAVAVCGETTQAEFAAQLRAAGVEAFQACAERDDAAIAESVLAHAHARSARTLCFWNVAPGVKLLLAKFAPPALRLVDVSPGAYAFLELEGAAPLADALAFPVERYYERLDALVLKHGTTAHPPCRRVEVIRNGVALRAARSLRAAHPRFLVCGRIAPSKRLEVILDAFRLVQATHAHAQLDVAGPAEERHGAYLQRLRALSEGLRVTFRGADPGLACLDEPWSAVVVLGTHQGCPNAVLEAMAAGIPVIANDSGGTRELVANGDTGWLLEESCTAPALARAMAECAAHPERGEALARRALERVRGVNTLAAMAERYLRVLGAEEGARHAKMESWNSASARVAPPLSPSVPLPTTAG